VVRASPFSHGRRLLTLRSWLVQRWKNPGKRHSERRHPFLMTVAGIGATIAKHLTFEERVLPVKTNSYPPMIGGDSGRSCNVVALSVRLLHWLWARFTYEEARKATCDWPRSAHEPSNWRARHSVLAGIPLSTSITMRRGFSRTPNAQKILRLFLSCVEIAALCVYALVALPMGARSVVGRSRGSRRQ